MTSEADPADKSTTHDRREAVLQRPALLRLAVLKVITTDLWKYGWVTYSFSGRGEWGRRKMFSRISKKCRHEGGLIIPWSGEGWTFKGNT